MIADPRNPLLVTHSVVDILRARMLAIACGYEAMGNPDTPLGSGQKHHTAIRGETATIERTGDFLASNGWKPERLNRIIRRVWLGVIG